MSKRDYTTRFVCSSTLVLILMSTITLTSFLFFGCHPQGESSNTSEFSNLSKKSITIWHALRGADHEHLMQDLAAFERDTGERVTSLQLPHNAFANKLQVAIPRGNGPDLFIGAHDRVGDWAEAGLIEPISFWVDQADYEQYVPKTLEAFSYHRQLYGLPISCKALALFYNPTIVPAPKTVESLVEIITQLKTNTRERKEVWGLAYPEIDSLYFHAPWLHAFGGAAILNGEPKLSSVAMKRSLTFIKRLRDQTLIPPELDGALASSLFRSGKLAYLINGPWFIAELQGLSSSQWAVTPLPTLEETGRKLSPYLSVEGVMISAYSTNPRRAWKLAQYLSSEEVSKRRLKRGELTARAHLNRSDLSPWLQTFQAQVKTSTPMSNDPKMKALWTPAKRAIGQAILYKAPIENALIEAQMSVKRAINGGHPHGE